MLNTPNIFKLALLFGLLIFSSCESDDSNPYSENSKIETEILGTWNLVGYTSTLSMVETEKILIENGSNYNYTIEFSTGPKFINSNGSYTVNVEETNSENQTSSFYYVITSNENQQEGVHKGEWSIDKGNLITQVYDTKPNETGSFYLTSKIVNLTPTQLILEVDNSAFNSENHTITGKTLLKYTR